MTSQFITQCMISLVITSVTSAQPAETNNSLIWKVTSAKGAVSYVFGTIHLPDTLMFRQRDTILTLHSAAKTFYAELDLDSLMTSVDPMSMMLPPGKTLANYFTAEELTELRSILKERLGPMALMAERMKPVAIAMMAMAEDIEPTAPTTIDQFLWERAKQRSIPVKGIESIDEQLKVLDSIPARLILEALRQNQSSDSLMQTLRVAYSTEKLEDISRLIDSVSSVESFMTSINDDRNITMADRLREPLETGGAFIAIGAAHLPGQQGLLNTLKVRGYIVEPVLGGKRKQWLSE